jgi:hypothetical protein
MQQSKAEEDEKQYLTSMKQFITNIYMQAVQTAKTSATSCMYRCDRNYLGFKTIKDDTLTDSVTTLRELFPGCRVTHSKMARGTNGQMHDVSQMDELTNKLIEMKVIDVRRTEEYIVVDWS